MAAPSTTNSKPLTMAGLDFGKVEAVVVRSPAWGYLLGVGAACHRGAALKAVVVVDLYWDHWIVYYQSSLEGAGAGPSTL